MALQISYNDDFGGMNLVAYHRIVQLRWCLETQEGVVTVAVYRDERSREAQKQSLAHRDYVVSGEPWVDYFGTAHQDQVNVNPLRESYRFLKSLPEYVGAVDV